MIPHLEGIRILLTGGHDQSLRQKLVDQGATVLEVPAIRIDPPADSSPLADALSRLPEFDWIAFLSRNAVEAAAGHTLTLGKVLVASVGPGTSEAIRALFGRSPDLEPETDFRAQGLLAAFPDVAGKKVLIPASERGRPTLPEGLRARGAKVQVVVAYRVAHPEGLPDAFARAFEAPLDLVILLSPSAVEGFSASSHAKRVPVAVLGPTTGEAAREAGLDVKVVAHPSTLEGLLRGIRSYFS